MTCQRRSSSRAACARLRRVASLALFTLLAGPAASGCAASMAMESQELVLSELSVYVPRSPNSGLSYGVNLDGVVSSGHDDGCTAQADATSADGSNTGGIDNAFGYSFELLGIQPTSPPAESAVPFIASGQLALGLRLRVAR